jgi:hypothetical protein
MNASVRRNGRKVSRDEGWELFRMTYGVQRDDIMTIKALADPARHGNRGLGSAVSDSERANAFRLTWDIINRFVSAETSAR